MQLGMIFSPWLGKTSLRGIRCINLLYFDHLLGTGNVERSCEAEVSREGKSFPRCSIHFLILIPTKSCSAIKLVLFCLFSFCEQAPRMTGIVNYVNCRHQFFASYLWVYVCYNTTCMMATLEKLCILK